MNKEQVLKEIEEKWRLFDMNDEELKEAYYQISGIKEQDYEWETIEGIKQYLYDYIIESMIKDGDIKE